MKLHPVELERLTPEILHVFGRQPPLLTAGDKTGLNTMTIGWCQLGRLWNLPVCTVYVRPGRGQGESVRPDGPLGGRGRALL